MNSLKILRNFVGTPAIFFPIGRLETGGTCEFATKKCLQECIALKNPHNLEIYPYKTKSNIYNFITTEPINYVINTLLKDLKEANSSLLFWFASGDCPKKDTNKIMNIINILANSIYQMGFTRNIELYRKIKRKNIRFMLTCENKQNLDDILYDKDLISIPNYRKGYPSVYQYKKKDNDYTLELIKEKDDATNSCTECLKQRKGCWKLRNKSKNNLP